MKHNIFYYLGVAIMTLGASSCSEEPATDNNIGQGKLKMEFAFTHPSATRATETSFENNDVVGLFVNETAKPLEISGNTVNNAALTFNGTSWNASRPLYWDEGTFNLYGYYPYMDDICSISDLPFEISTDQRKNNQGIMDGYESSDFLYASALGISASSDPVHMQFRHIMSKLTVRLIKGEDYEGDIPATALVQIHNTVPAATIDLEAGIATKDKYGVVKTITARQESPIAYSAIIVPQRLDNRVPLIEVVMEGVSFLVESKFQFKPGTHHFVNLVIDSNPDKIKIEIGGEITNWN